jgi:predicted nucleic-acid-binding protein
MIILDANYILRFLLKDDENMYEISKSVIETNRSIVLNEVIAEVVFVLQKVYKVSKYEISQVLIDFISFQNIINDEKTLIIEALKVYSEKNLDFIDAILCAKSKQFAVKTFDKKLNNCLKNV